MEKQMTAAHDYFADCAENFISYLFAHARYAVYGSGKWEADVVVRDKKTDKWYRVEVRSTDGKKKKPSKKGSKKLAGNADLYAEVRLLEGNRMGFKLWFLDDRGHKIPKRSIENCSFEDLRGFISAGP